MHDAAGTPPFGIAAALALVAGIGACLACPVLAPAWLDALVLAIGLAGWWRLLRWQRVLAIAGCGFALAALHAGFALSRQLPADGEHEPWSVTGCVVDLPAFEPQRTRFRFRVDDDPSTPVVLRSRLLQLAWYDGHASHRHSLQHGRTPSAARMAIAPGACWHLDLKLRAPRGLRNAGGFDGERHALAERIAATGYVTDPDAARQVSAPRGIDAWRARMSARIAAAIPTPTSRFVRALALGDTRGLDDRDWEQLRADGITHLIAISGFHVGLVAGLAALFASALWRSWPGLGRRLPRPQAAALAGAFGALGYAAVAGFALPTVRTLLMIAIVVMARLARRAQRAVDALALAAFAILLTDPLSVLAPGFWLSFVGVGWLLWCLPDATTGGWRAHLRGFFSAQAVATIGLLPLAAVLFGQASLAGPLANLVAIPWWSLVVVPLTLVGTGLDALHAGWGTQPWHLAAWCFDLAWPLFQSLAASPLALLLWLPLLWPQRDLPKPGDVDLQVIDVGQGLSVLVRTHGHALLYDTGPAVPDGFDAGESAVVPTLHALGVRRLDAIVVSHGDNDHAGGFAAVARAFPPRLALTPAGAPPLPEGRPCLAGTHWQWDGVRLRFLHPPRDFPYLDNESGCVLRVESRHGVVLLPADVGEAIEQRMLDIDPESLRADVVLMPHHGSSGSSSPAFVAATHARLAIASTGYDNRFHHPRPEVVARWREAGARVVNTADSGAVQVRLSGNGIAIAQERLAHRWPWDAAARRPAASH